MSCISKHARLGALAILFGVLLDGVAAAQRPDLSGLSPAIGTWISQICAREPGPAFFQCQSRQAAAARDTPRPDLSALSLDDRRRVALACSSVAMQGPAIYWPCLTQKAGELAMLPPAPALPPGSRISGDWDPTIPTPTQWRASPFLTGPAPAFKEPGTAK